MQISEKRLQEIKDSIDFQRELLIANNMKTLCVDEEQELYDEILKLQQRIDKAIETLEESIYDGEIIRIGGIENYILNILKGDSDE